MTIKTDPAGVRDTAVYELSPTAIARGQNFWVQWMEGPNPTQAHSTHEIFLLLVDAGATVVAGNETREVPARSICVLPAGQVSVTLSGPGRAALIASSRTDISPDLVRNEADYAKADARIRPIGAAYERLTGRGVIQVIDIDAVKPPTGKPRLKMFQTETMSINWVEYDGPRDRSQLSPHSHADFEQGSLAISGDFLHHLRVTWGGNANLWRDDLHLRAPSPSMLTVPVELVHTTEGVGDGPHLLIDVFAPPRDDFIGSGWVANAADYKRREEH
jgi:hypothetical protein